MIGRLARWLLEREDRKLAQQFGLRFFNGQFYDQAGNLMTRPFRGTRAVIMPTFVHTPVVDTEPGKGDGMYPHPADYHNSNLDG
jgi:hypothetical protein